MERGQNLSGRLGGSPGPRGAEGMSATGQNRAIAVQLTDGIFVAAQQQAAERYEQSGAGERPRVLIQLLLLPWVFFFCFCFFGSGGAESGSFALLSPLRRSRIRAGRRYYGM